MIICWWLSFGDVDSVAFNAADYFAITPVAASAAASAADAAVVAVAAAADGDTYLWLWQIVFLVP